MDSYIFNHDYILRHDEKRTFIVQKNRKNDSSYGWISVIHPIQAMILSFFSESNQYDKVIEEISYFLETNKQNTIKIIEPFIENSESFYTEHDKQEFRFPKNVLIKTNSNKSPIRRYSVEQFTFKKLDFVSKRFYTGPLNITLMPTNVCATNCIYCYADKSYKVKDYLSLERIKEILDEANELNVMSFEIVGGEVFKHPEWEKILQYYVDKGFDPKRISTKVPLNREDISKLKKIGINKIQVSLDTLLEKNLNYILKTNKNYFNQIVESLKLLDEENIDIKIQTILTKYNCTREDMLSIFNYIKSFKNVNGWAIRPAFTSIYNGNDFVPSLSQINEVFNSVEPLKLQIKNIDYDRTFLDRGYMSIEGGSENFEGAECSSNRSHIFILPDGKVTICEQLYWKPNFIIGDISKDTIKNVWNSEHSLFLYNLKKSDLSENNPCKVCEIFDSCYKNMNRCWAEVVKAYGDENWDYPDPRCKMAPKMRTNLIYQ